MGRVFLLFLIAFCVFIGYHIVRGSLEKAFREPNRRGFGSPESQGEQNDGEIETRYRDVLGVSHVAGEDEIKAAYRSQLAKYHPDKVTHLGDEFYDLASARTKRIIEAYNYLKQKYGFK